MLDVTQLLLAVSRCVYGKDEHHNQVRLSKSCLNHSYTPGKKLGAT